jgi:hypothetical protein
MNCIGIKPRQPIERSFKKSMEDNSDETAYTMSFKQNEISCMEHFLFQSELQIYCPQIVRL